MLTGTTILKGHFSFGHPVGMIDEELLRVIANVIFDIIDDNFDGEEYRATKRFDNAFNKLSIPVMNKNQLFGSNFHENRQISFYSHSKTLDIGELAMLLDEYLESLDSPYIYKGLTLNFDYSSIEFNGKYPTIVDAFTTVQVHTNDKGHVWVDDYLQNEVVYEVYELEDLLHRSNLFVFDGHTYDGVSNLHSHLTDLYSRSESRYYFDGFDDKNTEIVAELSARTLGNYPIGTPVINEGDMFSLKNILKGTMEEKFLIGTSSLLTYMEDVSPLILKEIMRKGQLTPDSYI